MHVLRGSQFSSEVSSVAGGGRGGRPGKEGRLPDRGEQGRICQELIPVSGDDTIHLFEGQRKHRENEPPPQGENITNK